MGPSLSLSDRFVDSMPPASSAASEEEPSLWSEKDSRLLFVCGGVGISAPDGRIEPGWALEEHFGILVMLSREQIGALIGHFFGNGWNGRFPFDSITVMNDEK